MLTAPALHPSAVWLAFLSCAITRVRWDSNADLRLVAQRSILFQTPFPTTAARAIVSWRPQENGGLNHSGAPKNRATISAKRSESGAKNRSPQPSVCLNSDNMPSAFTGKNVPWFRRDGVYESSSLSPHQRLTDVDLSQPVLSSRKQEILSFRF